ncbi:hypothetical protein D3C78_1242670 [compost metagenome]
MAANFRNHRGIGRHIEAAIRAQKASAAVMLQQLYNPRMLLRRSHRSRLQKSLILEAGESVMAKEDIKRLNDLNIRVQINAAMLPKRIKPDIIANKRKLAGFISLLHIAIGGDIEAILIPLHELVTAQIFFPALHAFLKLSRLLPSAKPAIMHNTGDLFSLAHAAASFPTAILNTCSYT